MTKVCSAKIVVSPAASSLPNVSVRLTAMRMPRPISVTYSSSTAAVPRKPSSSPIAAKMKSVSAYGISHGDPCPSPEPTRPPVDMPNQPCASCPKPCLYGFPPSSACSQ